MFYNPTSAGGHYVMVSALGLVPGQGGEGKEGRGVTWPKGKLEEMALNVTRGAE